MGTNLSGLRAGDDVVISITDLETIIQMQMAHGGWNDSMNECLIGPCKVVQNLGLDAIVRGPSGSVYRLNSKLLSRYGSDTNQESNTGLVVELIEDEKEFRRLQVQHGEWNDNMKNILGKKVQIINKFPDGDIKVQYNNSTFVINPKAIAKSNDEKVSFPVDRKFKVGDKILLIENVDTMRKLQENHGGWSDLLSLYVGQEVEIMEIFEDGDMYVSKFGMEWMINPKCIDVKDNNLKIGDTVLISSDIQKIKQLQINHGGWVSRMSDFAGKYVKVEAILPAGDIQVNVNGLGVVYNPLLLTKSDKSKIFAPGDKIRLINDKKKIKLLQKNHGEWINSMKLYLGKKGTVKSLFADGDLRVEIMNQDLTLNPECVEATDSDSDSDPDILTMMKQLTELINSDSDQSEQEDNCEDPNDEKTDGNEEEVIKFFIAVKSGEMNKVMNLVESVGVNTRLKGISPLMIAVNEGHIDMVKLMIEKRVNLDAKDKDGDTALHLAVQRNQIKICDLLINKGADVNAQNKKHITPIMLSAMAGSQEITRLLAASRNANLSIGDSDDDTALHLAVKKSRLDSVEILLDAGANINALNKKLFNVFHLAAMQGHAKILELFLKREGVKIVDSQKEDKYAAIHLVVLNNHADCLRVLLKYKADINIRNNVFQTALHVAVSQKHLNCVKILVEHSAEINLKDSDGDTPLHVAMKIKQIDEIKRMGRLFGMGAILGILGDMAEGSDTPDDIAIYLLKNGAGIDIKNKKGRTPMDMCDDDLLKARILSLDIAKASKQDMTEKEQFQLAEVKEFQAPAPLVGATAVKQVSLQSISKSRDEELEELRRRIQDMEDEKTCNICYDRPMNVTFGCGHMACDVCANNLFECHICREHSSDDNNSCLLILCPGCQHLLSKCHFIIHCENECFSKEMYCINRPLGCDTVVNRYLMKDHLIHCCKYRISKYLLCHETSSTDDGSEISLSNNCGEHCWNCIDHNCKEVTGCPIIDCSNLCGRRMHECKLSEHTENICERSIVDCVNVKYGCSSRILRSQRGVHLARCASSVVACTREWTRGVQGSKLYQASLDCLHSDSQKWCRHLHVELMRRANRICYGNFMMGFSVRDQLYLCSSINEMSRSEIWPALSSGTINNNLPDVMRNNEKSFSLLGRSTAGLSNRRNSTLQQTIMMVSQFLNKPLSLWNFSLNANYISNDLAAVADDAPYIVDGLSDDEISLPLDNSWRVQHLTLDQAKPSGTFTFQCGQAVPRWEYEGHWRQHCDLSAQMDGWIEITCPLAYLGCDFSISRFSKSTSELAYHPLLDAYCQRFYSNTGDGISNGNSILLLFPFEVLFRVLSFLDGCSLYHVSRTHSRLREAVNVLLSKRCATLDWYRVQNGGWKSKIVQFRPISLASLEILNSQMFTDKSIGALSEHLKCCSFKGPLCSDCHTPPFCLHQVAVNNSDVCLPDFLRATCK